MKTADRTARLYQEISQSLMENEKPSMLLNSLSEKPEFRNFPFSMLLDMKATEQSPLHHPEGNVWNHTMLVVDEAAARRNKSSDGHAFMWAALLHDIGKPGTTKVRSGKITAYNHERTGAELAEVFLSKFSDDAVFIRKVSNLIRYHMQMLFVLNDLPFKDIRGMREACDVREEALLCLCDRLGRSGIQRIDEERNARLFLEKLDVPAKENRNGKGRNAKTGPKGQSWDREQQKNAYPQ